LARHRAERHRSGDQALPAARLVRGAARRQAGGTAFSRRSRAGAGAAVRLNRIQARWGKAVWGSPALPAPAIHSSPSRGGRSLQRVPCRAPAVDPPAERADPLEAALPEHERRTGARDIVGSGAVENDVAVPWDLLVSLVDLFELHV